MSLLVSIDVFDDLGEAFASEGDLFAKDVDGVLLVLFGGRVGEPFVDGALGKDKTFLAPGIVITGLDFAG